MGKKLLNFLTISCFIYLAIFENLVLYYFMITYLNEILGNSKWVIALSYYYAHITLISMVLHIIFFLFVNKYWRFE